MKSTRYESLEGLRGLMAFWVWVSHVTTMATLPFDKHVGAGWILANGDFAVGVFVILSGFVISLSLSSSKSDTYFGFLIRRGFRLFPIYLISLYLSVLLLQPSIAALQQLPWDGPRTGDRLEIFQNTVNYFWQHLFLHTFLLHGVIPDKILPSTSFAFMGQAWSLTLEWQFYLVAPFAFAILSRCKLTHWLHLIVMLIVVAMSKVVGQPSFLGSLLFLFAVGYFAQRFLQELKAGSMTAQQVLLYVAIEAVLLSVTGTNFWAFIIWSCVFIPLVFSVRRGPSFILKLLESKPLQLMGNISYGFYCLHMVVMYGFVYLLIVQFGLQDRDTYIQILIPGTLIVTLILSYISYRWFEKPLQDYGKKLATRVSSRKNVVLQPKLSGEQPKLSGE